MSNPVSYHQLNIAKIERKTTKFDQINAQIRDEFFEENHEYIKKLCRQDLANYVSNKNIQYMKMPALDHFVYAFLDKLSNVYDREPVVRLLNDQNEQVPATDENLKKINKLLREVKFGDFGHDSQMKTRLHNTILRQVRYNKDLDKLYLQNGYNVGTTIVISYKDFSLEPEFVAYEYMRTDNNYQYVVWDRKGEVYYTNELKFDSVSHTFIGTKIKIGNNKNIKFNEYWPWIVQRYRNQNELFWGHGFDAIVELVRFMNMLLTVAGDDAIQETIRILILNFDPAGNKTEKGEILVGLRNPITVENAIPGKSNDPKGQIISADLHNKEILDFCYALADILGSLHNLPGPLKQHLEDTLSGIHLRIKNEPILQGWAKDIIKVRDVDIETIATLIKVNNHHRGVKNVGDNAEKTDRDIPEEVMESLSLDYQEPRIVTDPKEDLEVEAKKWDLGLSNPVLYVRTLNPDITSDSEAETFIKTNKEITAKLAKIGEISRKLGSLSFNKKVLTSE